jgi:hypothetical protein
MAGWRSGVGEDSPDTGILCIRLSVAFLDGFDPCGHYGVRKGDVFRLPWKEDCEVRNLPFLSCQRLNEGGKRYACNKTPRVDGLHALSKRGKEESNLRSRNLHTSLIVKPRLGRRVAPGLSVLPHWVLHTTTLPSASLSSSFHPTITSPGNIPP